MTTESLEHRHPLEERYRYHSSGVWSPLRQPVFRALWVAALVSNVGTNIQDVAGQIYTKGASTSAVWPALVQTATLLPMALFAFVAGAAADLLGSRRVVLAAQCWMLGAATLLALVAMSNQLTPLRFLGFTVLLNVGQAIATPAMFAVIPEMVLPRRDGQAYALNSLAFNCARAVGPLVAGFVIVHWGFGAAFICNAASFVAVIVVLARWHNRTAPHGGSPSLRSVMHQGARELIANRDFRSILARGGLFGAFGVALFALLPSVQHGMAPMDYGRLLSFFGLGIVLAIEVVGAAQRRLGLARASIWSCVLLGASAATVAFTDGWTLRAALVAAGVAWLIVNSSLVTEVKACVRDDERGRAMALYFVVLFLAMGCAAPVLGRIADVGAIGPRKCLAAAGVAMVAVSLVQLLLIAPRRSPAPLPAS
jgi:MFS family permease